MIAAAHKGVDWTGISSVLGALLTFILGYLTLRARKSASDARGDAAEAKGEAAEAKRTVAEIDRRAMETGTVASLHREIGMLQGQVVEMSRSTSEQLTRSTQALVDCEARSAVKDEQIAKLQRDLTAVANNQRTLESLIHRMNPDLIEGPDG